MEDLTGRKYGRLTVLEYHGLDKRNQRMWKCQCECGNIVYPTTNSLNMGRAKGCGHHADGNVKHGLCGTRIHSIHRDMLARCYNPHRKAFKRYGGRGIRVCDEWRGKEGLKHFNEWAIHNGYSDNLTIDRINNDGNYEPKNCRWVSNKTQVNNTSRNLYIPLDGETHTLAEWCEIRNLDYVKTYQRIHTLNWSYERALEYE